MRFTISKYNYNSLTDESLMQRVQQGICPAFDCLYQRFNERIYYYFFRMLGHCHEIAEDFTQDLFLKIIHKPQLFDPDRNFSTWIFSIAHNMCKNEYRNREVRSVIDYEEDTDSYCFEEEIKEKTPVSTNDIFAELDSLDEIHKTVFLLKYREGFDLQEIAEITNLPEGTIKSRLHYAKKKLQTKLEKKLTI